MAESASYSGLIVSLFLPWAVGAIWVRWLLGTSGRWNWFIVLGQGYLLGILATCLILFLWGTVSLSFHFWLTASCIFALGIGGLIA